jgi:bifunctional non-homologous end joining protein LigD
VYLDALRMALGATVVPPYVVRATPQATVSMPVTWQELGRLESPDAFTVRTAPARLARTGDLWAALAPTATFAEEPEGEESG